MLQQAPALNFTSDRRMQALLAVQKAILTPEADMATLMETVVQSALAMLPHAEGAVIEMLENQEMYYSAASGMMKPFVGLRLKAKGSLSGLCVKNNEPLYCEDSEADSRVDINACRKVGLRSMMVMPLLHRGDTVGVLKVCSPHPHAFTDDERLMMHFFVIMISAGFGSVAESKALTALRDSEERFQRVVRGSSVGIWDWDILHDTMYYSPRFKQILGYAEEEMGNSRAEWSGLVHPEDLPKARQALDFHLNVCIPFYFEYRVRSKSGVYIWVEVRGQAEWDDFGIPVRMTGSLINISERKKLEELRTEFFHTVTHELRTPLTTLKGTLDMMARSESVDMPEGTRKLLALAMRGGDRLMTLVNDLLDLGQMEAGQLQFNMESLPLASLLEEVVDLMRPYTRNGIALELIPARPVTVRADKNRLVQVMANLISNAVKFSRPGGKVEIAAGQEGGYAVISIRDYGQGIAQEFQPHIFERFSQAQKVQGSSGLGLSITKNMVERMNGAIRFESKEGEGTIFFVELPAEPQP